MNYRNKLPIKIGTANECSLGRIAYAMSIIPVPSNTTNKFITNQSQPISSAQCHYQK